MFPWICNPGKDRMRIFNPIISYFQRIANPDTMLLRIANPQERELYSVGTATPPGHSVVTVKSVVLFVNPFIFVLILYQVAFCSGPLKV